MTIEEIANKYAEETILALYSDSELMQDFVQKLKKYAKVDFLAGYNEAMRCQSSSKIKQLEWDFYGTYYSAETPVGHYMILQGDEQYWENYITCTLTYNDHLIADFNSIKEAQSTAQKDFEARVKECLIAE